MPKEGVAHHNLGTALLRLAQARGNDRALLEEAAKSLREAVALGGRRAPHFNVRLAEALLALGDRKGAEAALREAFAVNPIDPVLMMARASSLADVPAQGGACKVDFNCKKGCPPGITGRIMMVACEIANSNAVRRLPRRQALSDGIQLREQDAPVRHLHPGPRSRASRSRHPGARSTSPCRATAASIGRPASVTPPVGGASRRSPAPKGGYQSIVGRGQFQLQPRRPCSTASNNSNFLTKKANAFDLGASGVWRHDGSAQRTKVSLDAGQGCCSRTDRGPRHWRSVHRVRICFIVSKERP